MWFLFLLFKIIGYTVVILVTLIVALLWYLRPYAISTDLPGPKRLWPVGVTFQDSKDFLDGASFEWDQWPTLGLAVSRKFNFQTWGGPTLNIGFGGAFFNVVSPECLQYILKDNFSNYVKGNLVKSFEELLGQAIFTTDGDLWKFHRKIVISILSRETVQHGAQLMNAKLYQVQDFLLQKDEQVIDFQDLAYKMIFDVFVKLAFGVELDQLKNESDSDDLFPFVHAFNQLQYYTHLRFNDFLWEMKQKFCIGERERKVVECRKIIDEFAFGIIRQTKQNACHKEGKDVVSRFLQYCRDQKEREPTDKELRDFVMTFVMAGRDSTASALSWTMWELTRHPTYVDNIREEVDRICKDEFTYENVEKLRFTHAVIMETLRLHSPAPDSFRFAVEDDKLPDGTRIPAGSLVMYSPYTVNHCEKIWGTDADQFDPTRWLGKGEPSPFRFPTFNGGPRTCPGRPLALMELKMSLAFLVSKFDFEDLAGHDGSYKWTIVMAMKDGFPVQVKQRR